MDYISVGDSMDLAAVNLVLFCRRHCVLTATEGHSRSLILVLSESPISA